MRRRVAAVSTNLNSRKYQLFSNVAFKKDTCVFNTNCIIPVAVTFAKYEDQHHRLSGWKISLLILDKKKVVEKQVN